MKSIPVSKKQQEEKASALRAQRKTTILIKRKKAPLEKGTPPALPPECLLTHATRIECVESREKYTALRKCLLCDRGGFKL